MNYMILWLGLTVLFALVEAGTVALVSVWFAAGSLCALIAAVLGAGPVVQTVVFLVVSGILLAALRPLARKYTKKTRTNVDSLPGTEGIVTEDIHNLEAVGRVKLGAMSWAARSTSGDPIPAGTVVRVDRIEGVRAFVTPVKENVEI